MSRAKTRAGLMEELEHAMRRSSAQGVLFGQSIANHVGLSNSDMEGLDFVILEGCVTAGRLAEVTGLTTGAITGVVDRLEQAGLVRRERDDNDRRKVFIVPVPESVAKIGKFYEHMQRAMLKAWDTYSDAELKLLLRFATQGYETMRAATEELKAMIEDSQGKPGGKRGGAKKPVRAP